MTEAVEPKKGMRATLKSGGPVMTITKVMGCAAAADDVVIDVAWFHEGAMHAARLPLAAVRMEAR